MVKDVEEEESNGQEGALDSQQFESLGSSTGRRDDEANHQLGKHEH